MCDWQTVRQWTIRVIYSSHVSSLMFEEKRTRVELRRHSCFFSMGRIRDGGQWKTESSVFPWGWLKCIRSTRPPSPIIVVLIIPTASSTAVCHRAKGALSSLLYLSIHKEDREESSSRTRPSPAICYMNYVWMTALMPDLMMLSAWRVF